LRFKNLTHTFVKTMFHFRINASIVTFLSNHISFGILMTTFFKICFKILKKPQVLRLKFDYSSLINTIYILSAMLLSCVLSRVVYANNIPPHVPRNMGWNIVKRNAGPLIDDVRRDIAINFMRMPTLHELSFLIGQFEFEV
jgi:hypothetical protein